jgi:lycopene cyclase domain-containing protein
LNPHYTYFLILAGSLIGPLILSFDKKVAFYKKWKQLIVGMIFPAMFYIIWDMVFTKNGVWSFNEDYITGIKLYNLPVEEVLFFFIVPYCCVFIYECVINYFPKIQQTQWGLLVLKLIGFVLLLVAILNHNKDYTFYTFFFNGIFIFILTSSTKYFQSFNINAFLISYLIILIPFLIVNGLLTSIPVVLYNNNENLNFRIYTIPFEDIFYGMLLIMMNIAGYEKSKHKVSQII